MRIKRFLSGFLAVTLALSCINWRAASAQNVQTSNTTNSTYATEISDTNLEALTENSQILEHVDSEQFFDAEHIARLPEEETLDSYVFLNRDGSKSIYYMGQPVKYVDSNGFIQEKDTTLIRSNGGYCMRNNDIHLHIPDAVATGITVAYNNQTVKLTPQGGSGSAQQYDNSIVYYDYYGKGTILRYTPMLSGVKEDIILAKYTGRNSFTFLLETNGLQLYEDQGQYYLAENQDISAAFYLGQVEIYDAIGRPDLGTMTAETIIPGQKYQLTIAANESFLLDPETVYPVTIDPTVTVRDSADVSGTVEDAPVFSGYANRSFGDYVFNNIGYVDGYKLARTAFRLTSLLADSKYNQLSAEQLNSVSFHLKGSGGQFANLSLHALTENATWTESTLTWNNLGTYSETAYTTVRMGSSVWKTFDITALAKDWKTGAQNPDCGFVLISDSTTSSVSTFSAEYSTVDYRPYVVVNYTGTIALNQVSATLSVGGTLALTATTTPTGQVVSWASEDPTVAEVSEDGVVTALSLGTTTITASLEDGATAECEVTVVAKSISLNYNTSDMIASVYKGETITLIATTEPAGEAVDWVSLNPEIATVANGVVTGISVGTATIKAVLSDGTYAECRVYVLSKDISLNSTNITLYVDDTKRLIATTVPPGEDVEWISLNPDVATVSDNGVVTAVGAGETTIRAYIDDETYAICAVTVKRPTIALNTTRIEIAVGESFLLTANPDPFTSRLYWNSHDSSIASVSSGGNVTGVAPGETYITIRASTGVITFCFVTVIEQQISISGESSVREGESLTLSVTKRPTEWNVIWTSSDPSIATVSQTGKVTGIKAGTVTITATMEDGPSATHTVYVAIADGVYYIQNLQSGFYLHVSNGGITSLTDVYQYSKYSSTTSDIYKIRQMWKIRYLGEGRYSIRPMHKLDMGLDITGDNVDIYRIGTDDTLIGVPSYTEWTISWYSTGYVFKNNGSDSKTMQIENASASLGGAVVASAYSTSVNCRWGLTKISSPPSGAYWFDTNTERVVSESSTETKTIDCGSSSNAETLGLVPVLYSPSTNNQTFTWTSDDTTIAAVNYTSGLISAKNAGNVVITATSSYGKYKLQLNILAKSLDPFHYHNIQYMRYVRITGTNWWGLGSDTDHTINIVKSIMYSDDYCIIHDNINTGYYREIYINDELKNTLNNLETGYQEHYSWLPLLDTTTEQENAAHSSKGETDQLVEDGYFAEDSSEYYGVWAYNYISTLNLLDYWRGVIDTTTAAYGVYLTATSFYYSYLMSTSTTSMQVTTSQYSNTASIIDDIDDALSGMNYSGKTTLSAESRNAALSQQGYTSPLPYKPQTPVVKYQQTSSTQYVRVFTDSNKTGKWLMKYSDIQGLTPAQIQSKFALPSTPTHYCFVNVPSGATVYVGVVNQSSVSGTLQYELGTVIPDSAFGTSILLP